MILFFFKKKIALEEWLISSREHGNPFLVKILKNICKNWVSHVYLHIIANKNESRDSTELSLYKIRSILTPPIFHIETVNINSAPKYSSVKHLAGIDIILALT